MMGYAIPWNCQKMVQKSNRKAVKWSSRTRPKRLKNSFSLDDVRALEKIDSKGNTSLQNLLTSITTSLKEAEEALGAPEPVGVAAPKGDQEWKEATAEASRSCPGKAVSEATDEDLDRTLTGEEVCRVATISSILRSRLETVVTNGGESVVECDPLRGEPRAELSRARLCSVRARPSRAEPSRAKPSRAEPSRAEPNRA